MSSVQHRRRRQGEDGERQLCNWLTLEGLAQVQIAQPLCCKLQTFVSPQVECFFQTLSLLHIWVQFSACPLSENQFLHLSSAVSLQLCEQTRAKGLRCPSPVPSKTTNVSYQLTTPLPSRRKRQRKPSKLPQYRCVFWVLSVNRGNSFHTWSLSYLQEPWENLRTAPEGGKKGGERENCCFSTSASNQSPEITAAVYGLWSKLLFRTTRERVGWGMRRGSGEKGESQGPEGVEVRGERLGGIGPFSLIKHILI